MRVVRDIFLFLLTFYIAIVAFMPKTELYYYLEKKLKEKGVVIYNEKFKETPLALDISNGIISYQGLDVARFSLITFKPYLFLNTLEAKNIELLDMAKKALDVDIESLKAKHTILKPFIINLDIVGSFGEAKGYIELKEHLVHIDILTPKNIKPLKRFLRKGEKGWYYESRF